MKKRLFQGDERVKNAGTLIPHCHFHSTNTNEIVMETTSSKLLSADTSGGLKLQNTETGWIKTKEAFA